MKQPPARYAEAGLVRRLDELGIGRPSTWTAVLAVLREGGYIVVRDRHLAPSERGRVVTAFLEDAFGRWVDYEFTAAMEADLDRIAEGALAWRRMLEGFWAGFRPALDEAGALKRESVREAVEEWLAGLLFGARGRRCPACGEGRLELGLSRYGPFVGCAVYPACGFRRGLRRRRRTPGPGRAISGPIRTRVRRSASGAAPPAGTCGAARALPSRLARRLSAADSGTNISSYIRNRLIPEFFGSQASMKMKWWRRRESNPRPLALHRRLYMLSLVL